MSEKLTPKQEAFCVAYLVTGNASEAYRQAYSAEKMKASTIVVKASELLSIGKVSVRVKELQDSIASDAIMTCQEALERLTTLARTGISDLVDFRNIEMGKDSEGCDALQSVWSIKDSVMQDQAKMAAISELTAGRDGLKIKAHSPLQAIQQIAKMRGWEAAAKHEHTGKGGGPIQQVTYTADDYRKAQQELEGELDGLD